MLRPLISVACLTVLTVQVAFGQANAKEFGNYSYITENRLRAHLTFIANDLLEGRDTPSRGLNIASEYIAAQMALLGAKPGGENGTYFQTMKWGTEKLDPAATTLSVNGKSLTIGEDFIPTSLGSVEVTGDVVFVPSGWAKNDGSVNPYKGIDVKGKIVVTDGQGPDGVNRRDLFTQWTNPGAGGMDAGALAVVTIESTPDPAQWKRNLDRLVAGGRYRVMDSSDTTTFPVLAMSTEAAQPLFSAQIATPTADGLKAAGLKSSAKISLKMTTIKDVQTARNVIAVVPGVDPVLKNEYVGVGAHYDHLGIGRADAKGDTIYNGADDDGSGTVALLEMAHALMTGVRPRRSVVFIWHCGEEKGLVGSHYFATHPTIDLKQMKFMVNIDMIGMAKKEGDTNPANKMLAGKHECYLIGPKTISTTMRPIIDQANAAVDNIKLNDYYDRVDDPERIFYRSDHISYIEQGVPAVFMFSGLHENYHRPSDEVSAIDFDQLKTNAQTLLAITFKMAMLDKCPVIDKEIPGIGRN